MNKKSIVERKRENFDIKVENRTKWITMSNALTRAAHGLSLSEKRLIAIAIANNNSLSTPDPYNLPKSRVTAKDYAEQFGTDIHNAYKQLKEASRQLHRRYITFYEPAEKRKGKPLPPTVVQMNWIGYRKYQDGEGWVEIGWIPELARHLFGLKRQFTSYQLQQTSALRSIYSWKLLELLCRFKSTGIAEYDIDDFSTSMELTEKQRSNFNNIRRRVIEPAVKELIQKDGWLIDWEAIKGGRRVKTLRFRFVRDPQLKLDL